MIIPGVKRCAKRWQITYAYKLYLALLFLLSSACYSQRTLAIGGTIIVHKSVSGFYIGVDSKGIGDTLNKPICKIHIVGKTVIAMVGIDGLNGLDLGQIARKTISDDMSYLQMMEVFGTEANKTMKRLIAIPRAERNKTHQTLVAIFLKGGASSDTLFGICDFEASIGSSNYLVVGFTPSIVVQPPDVENPTQAFGVTNALNIPAILDALIEAGADPNRVGATIKGAILTQIIATPNLVGDPVYVLRIEPNGTMHWIGERPDCKDKTN